MAEAFDENRKPFKVTVQAFGTVEWTAEGHRIMAEKSGLPRQFSELEVAKGRGVTVRVVRDRARARGLGAKIGDFRWFTEAEIVGLWEEGSKACPSNSTKGPVRPTSMRAARITDAEFSKALELATEKKPKGCSKSSVTTSSKNGRVVPFPKSKPSRAQR